MTVLFDQMFLLRVQKGEVAGHSLVHKFGKNPDIDAGFETVWNGGGLYTGHDCIVAETLETFSSAGADAGSVLSSGTLTSGSATTLVDTGATFATDTVAAGDVVINDTQLDHAIVTSLTGETTINFLRWDSGTTPAASDAYRVATKASTGTPVVKLGFLLDSGFDNETSEYIVTNGVTGVDTSGTYIRHSRARCIGGDNAGAITTRQKTTTANITMVLPIAYNATMIAAYTIPAGKTGYLTARYAGMASKKAGAFSNVRLMSRHVNDVHHVEEEWTLAATGSSYIEREYTAPKGSFPAMTDISVRADSDTADLGISAGFDILLVDD